MGDKPAGRKKRKRNPLDWDFFDITGELIGFGFRLLFRAIGKLFD